MDGGNGAVARGAANKKKAAGGSGGFFRYSHVWSCALFELLGDVIELGIERAADRIDEQ